MHAGTKTILAAALSATILLAGCGGSGTSGSSSTGGSSAASSEPKQVEQPQPQQAQSPYAVTIDGATAATDYEGKPAVVVTFTFTNNSDETTEFASACGIDVYQNGVECDMGFVENVDTSTYMAKVQPGATTQVTLAYSVKDNSDVQVDVTPLFSSDIIASQTFKLA